MLYSQDGDHRNDEVWTSDKDGPKKQIISLELNTAWMLSLPTFPLPT